ncbi:hypothetical protein [Sphingobium mellinum]|uniref:hypothetical protein n=1 Tax=Sphingobium mellinum TaxID=1387166 RepID=UPI0030EE74EE
MSEYLPSLHLRAGNSTTAADFVAHVDSMLTIDSLVNRFSEALGLQAVSHACYAIDGEDRRFLFGEAGLGSAAIAARPVLPPLCFPVTGWDEKPYEVDIILSGMLETGVERANLHAMAVLYLCRGIALLDAREDAEDEALTETELFCLDQRRRGLCDLDIAEALDRSVQAVKIHIQRAQRKQRG